MVDDDEDALWLFALLAHLNLMPLILHQEWWTIGTRAIDITQFYILGTSDHKICRMLVVIIRYE